MKRFFSSLIAVSLLLPLVADGAVVAHWRFENNLLDSSGNGLHGASADSNFSYSTNVPGTVISPDLPNQAAYQRPNVGNDTTTTVAASPLLNATFEKGSFTVEAFVLLNTPVQDYRVLLSNRSGSSGVYFSVGSSAAQGYFAGTNGNGVDGALNSLGALTSGDWHHVAWVGTYTLSGPNRGLLVRFYLNGVETGPLGFFGLGSDDTALIMNNGDWKIGGASNNFNGLIDELRISNTALTPGEFLSASTPPPVVPEPGTLGLLLLGAVALGWYRRGRTV